MTNQLIKNVLSRPATHARRMADDLRKIANTLDRAANEYAADCERPAAAHTLTGRVLHELSWGFANLNLDLLNQSAIDVDAALRAQATIDAEDNWEYSIAGLGDRTFATKEDAAEQNERFADIDIDPGRIMRRHPGTKPGEWEVAP